MKDLDEKLNAMVNGQLDENELKALDEELEKDAELQNDLAFRQALKSGLQQSEATPPGEIGLARLKRDIKRQGHQNQAVNAQENKRNQVNHWKTIAIAACLVLGVQFYLQLPSNTTEPGSVAPNIAPLSGQSNTANSNTLQIVFSDAAQVSQIQVLLNDIQGSIVDGPGALGIYTLAVPKETDMQQLNGLLHTTDIVEEVVISQAPAAE